MAWHSAGTASEAAVELERVSSNRWLVTLHSGAGSQTVRAAVGAAGPTDSPAEVLRRSHASFSGEATPPALATLCAAIEHDLCGAWVTLATAGPARAVAVRRAGWIDVRGNPTAPLGADDPVDPIDDRVGLGPGDSIVLFGHDRAVATLYRDDADAMLDVLLGASGRPADQTAAAVAAQLPEDGDLAIVVLAVPQDATENSLARVAAATGVAEDELVLPGYPLGDLQPELWHLPPLPPRLARLRLDDDTSSLRSVRSLIDRLLASWRLLDRVDDDSVKLLASELAANAVVHAGSPETVTVKYLGDVVRVEVDDRSPSVPTLAQADDEDISGRGLLIVDALAESWGVDKRPPGKRVWCEVPVGPPPG